MLGYDRPGIKSVSSDEVDNLISAVKASEFREEPDKRVVGL